MKTKRPEIERCLRALALARGPEKTFCPSEVARLVDPEDWRHQMPRVRAAAIRLVRQGVLRCTQRGLEVDPEHARGPLRFSLPPRRILSRAEDAGSSQIAGRLGDPGAQKFPVGFIQKFGVLSERFRG